MIHVKPVKQCSRCDESPAKRGQRYCRSCHADYMRVWRARQPPSPRAVKRAEGIAAIRALIQSAA